MAFSFLKEKIASTVKQAGAPSANLTSSSSFSQPPQQHSDPTTYDPSTDAAHGHDRQQQQQDPLAALQLRVETLEIEKKLLQDLIDRTFLEQKQQRHQPQESNERDASNQPSAEHEQQDSVATSTSRAVAAPGEEAAQTSSDVDSGGDQTNPPAPRPVVEFGSPRKVVSDWLAENSQKLAEANELQAKLEEVQLQLSRSEKRGRAFESALAMAQQELKDSDAIVLDLRKQLQVVPKLTEEKTTLEEKNRRLEAQLTDAQGTVSELMSKVSKTGQDKSQREKELSAIIAKTAQQSDDTMNELEEKNSQLQTANLEIQRLQKLLQSAPPTPPPTSIVVPPSGPTAEEWQARLDTERVLRNQSEERMRASHAADVEKMQEEHAKALEQDRSQHRDELARLQQDFQAERHAMRQQCETTMHELEDCKEMLRASEEKNERLESDLSALTDSLQALQRQLEEMAANVETAASREAELTSLVAEAERKLRDADAEAKVQQRMSQTLTKDLKQQLVRLEQQLARSNDELAAAQLSRSATDAASSPTSVLADAERAAHERETTELIRKNVALQEEAWCLKQTKESYEVEMVRLNEELAAKTALIRTHIVDDATRVATAGKRFGLFGPKPEDIAPEIQKMLEKALFENLQLQTEIQRMARTLERAQQALDAAVEQGYGYRVEEDDGDDQEDDKFQ